MSSIWRLHALTWCATAQLRCCRPVPGIITAVSFRQVYVKQVLSDGRAKSLSNWTLVFYLNLGQMLVAFATCVISLEFTSLYKLLQTTELRSEFVNGKFATWCFVGVSCIFGAHACARACRRSCPNVQRAYS